jgi:hypothetical protein
MLEKKDHQGLKGHNNRDVGHRIEEDRNGCKRGICPPIGTQRRYDPGRDAEDDGDNQDLQAQFN